MKKITLALSLVMLICGAVGAQTKKGGSSSPLHLSFGVNFGVPLQDTAVTNFVVGGDLLVEYMLSSNFSAVASAGVDARLARGGVVLTVYHAPFLGGLRFYASNKFYISEQAGYSVAVTKGLESAFTNVASIGYKPSANSDISLGFKGIFYKKDLPTATTTRNPKTNTLSLINVRAAFVFGK